MTVTNANFGYCDADETCPDYKNDVFEALPYLEWGCVQCDHLKNLKESPIARGNELHVSCDKGHILLLFVAKDNDQHEEK